MKLPDRLRGLAAVTLLALGLALAPAESRAETVLVDSSKLVQSTQTFVFPFTVTGSGLLEITLSDLGWSQKLSSLTLVLADSKGVLHRLTGDGSFTFQLGSATHLFAHITGVAEGATIKIGLFGLRVRFHPPTPTVPLPAAAWLLLGGLGALGAARQMSRKQSV